MIASIQIGPFIIHRIADKLLIFHNCAGGPMPLSAFTEEVCPWDQVERGDVEKVAAFYARYSKEEV